MRDVTGFASVKLPADLVQQAREAAQPMRRSVAGQIEYWATLGRVAEHTGLSVQEAQTAIKGYESAARAARSKLAARALDEPVSSSLDAIKRRVLAVNADGSLQTQVRKIVQVKRRAASKRAAA